MEYGRINKKGTTETHGFSDPPPPVITSIAIEIKSGSATPLPVGTSGDMNIQNGFGQTVTIFNGPRSLPGPGVIAVDIPDGQSAGLKQTPEKNVVVDVVKYTLEPSSEPILPGQIAIPIEIRTVLSDTDLSSIANALPAPATPTFRLGSDGKLGLT